MLERDMTVIDAELPISAVGETVLVELDENEGFTVHEIHVRAPKGEQLVFGNFSVYFRVEGHDGSQGYAQQCAAVQTFQLPTGFVVAKVPVLGEPLYAMARAVGNGAVRGKIVAVVTAAYGQADKVAKVRILGYPDDLDA